MIINSLIMKLKLLTFSFAFVIVQNCFAVLTEPNPVSPANNATWQVTNVLLDWSYVASSGFFNPAINSFTINSIQNQKVTFIFVRVNERVLKFMKE
jgi:hypothetical protein